MACSSTVASCLPGIPVTTRSYPFVISTTNGNTRMDSGTETGGHAGNVGVLFPTRRRGVHDNRNLARALSASLRDPLGSGDCPLGVRAETNGQAGACPDRARAIPCKVRVSEEGRMWRCPKCCVQSTGQRREITATPGQPNAAADLRTGRVTRCANRPYSGACVNQLHRRRISRDSGPGPGPGAWFTARMKGASSPASAGLAHCPGGLPCRHQNRIPHRRERRSVREVQGRHLFYRHPVP